MHKPPSSYRCFFVPKDHFGHLTPYESGVLPFIQVKASSAEVATRVAHHVTGCPVSSVERIEQVEA